MNVLQTIIEALREDGGRRRTSRGALRGEAGMTLIEIMVVITILGIIMTIVGINVVGQLDKAKVGATEIQMKEIEQALTMYKVDHGKYPTTAEGLEALVHPPTTKSGKSFPSYLQGEEVPTDKWGNPFIYASPGTHGDHDYEITSLGADGAEGGDKTDQDIHSWELD